jgi:CheY-like chemotaxis protein
MPKKNGLDLLRQIKDHPDFKDIPVVMWSTSSIYRNKIPADLQDHHYFFQKPCSYQELIQELKIILHQNGLELQ